MDNEAMSGYVSPEERQRHAAIVVLARKQHHIDGECEIDEQALLSEGDENGCYVQAWVWADFAGTELDKTKLPGANLP